MPRKQREDLTGRKFGRLTVLSFAFRKKSAYYWNCVCECGTEKQIAVTNLIQSTKSCGCWAKEVYKRDAKLRAWKHGLEGTKEYRAWQGMKNRCNPDSNAGRSNYYGRGISVCDEWKNDFMAFYNHIGPAPSEKHSVDRIDNDRGYEPGNVRWATNKEQCRNKSDNHYIEFKGEKLTVIEWSERIGIEESAIRSRLRRGWTVEQTLTLPINANPFGRNNGRTPRCVEFNGESLPIPVWAKKLGMKDHLIRSRLKDGWPVESALTLPVGSENPLKRQKS